MNTNKLIIISAILLIFLVIVTLIFRGVLQQKQREEQLTPTPSSGFRTGGGRLAPLSDEQARRMVLEARNIKTLSSAQSDAFIAARDGLPIRTDDLDIGYSSVLDKYFITKKTPQADEQLRAFLEENGLTDIKQDFPELFVETTEALDETISDAEEELLDEKAEVELTPTPTTPPSKEKESKRDRDLRLFTDLLKTTLSFDLSGGKRLRDVLRSLEQSSPTGDLPQSAQPSAATPEPLANIFIEAGTKVGLPPRLLEAFMRQECGHVITLTPQKIEEYSAAGQGLPPSDFCFGNSYGAQGPMQFLPSTFVAYATTVNKVGGHNRRPYIQNILDSVYGAAAKIKSDGRARSADVWTQEEVFRAAQSYCGACNHVACPNYCQSVWDNYRE